MSNTAGICNSFKSEILQGIHAFGPGTNTPARTIHVADTFNGALMLASATLTPANVTTYTGVTSSELTGTGYTAGGKPISFTVVPVTDNSNNAAELDPNTGGGGTLVWTGLTSANPFDTLLIYNTIQGDRAVGLFSLGGSQSITAGTLTLTFPTAGFNTSLIQIS